MARNAWINYFFLNSEFGLQILKCGRTGPEFWSIHFSACRLLYYFVQSGSHAAEKSPSKIGKKKKTVTLPYSSSIILQSSREPKKKSFVIEVSLELSKMYWNWFSPFYNSRQMVSSSESSSSSRSCFQNSLYNLFAIFFRIPLQPWQSCLLVFAPFELDFQQHRVTQSTLSSIRFSAHSLGSGRMSRSSENFRSQQLKLRHHFCNSSR